MSTFPYLFPNLQAKEKTMHISLGPKCRKIAYHAGGHPPDPIRIEHTQKDLDLPLHRVNSISLVESTPLGRQGEKEKEKEIEALYSAHITYDAQQTARNLPSANRPNPPARLHDLAVDCLPDKAFIVDASGRCGLLGTEV